MQTPPSVPIRRFRSASVLSREPFDSHSARGSLHRVASSTSSSASETLNPVLRHHPPLRRAASELSERLLPTVSRYTSCQSSQGVPSPTTPLSSHGLSASEQLARRFARHVAGSSPEPGDDAPWPPAYSRLTDPPRSRGDTFMSSDELLAFREFLTRRAEDVLTDSRNLAISRDSPHDSGDFSEYGDPVPSDLRFDLHRPDKISGGVSNPGYNPLYLDTTVGSTTLEFLDDSSTKSGLLRALSIVRSERERGTSDEDSLLTSTLLDLYARSPSPMSQLQSEPTLYGNLHASHPEGHASPRSQLTDLSNPVATAFTCIEEMQEFVPDFLDLHPDVDTLGSAINDLSSSDGDSSPFLVHDERLPSVPEGSAAYSRQHHRMRVEGDRGDPVPAMLPPVNHLGPRKVQSAAELDPGRSQYARPLPSSHSYSQLRGAHSELQHSDLEGRHAYHQATSDLATDSVEMTRNGDAFRGYDNGTGSLAEFAELAYDQSIAEPDSRQREDPYYTKRVEDKQIRDGQHSESGLRMALDSSSPHELLPREVGPVFQRQRAMTMQEVRASDPPSQDRLHRSASTTTSITSRSSSSTGGRFRTLSDRAYCHPDVPYSPLDHLSFPKGAGHIVPPARGPFMGHDRNGLQVSPTETRSTPVVHSRGHSAGEVYSRYSSPRPFRPRPHMPPGHGRKDSYPIRERPVQSLMRRAGSSPELRGGASFTTGLPSSTRGVGLSLVDNGAFEAPRPAPEPRPHTHDKASVLSRMVPRGPHAALKKSGDDDARPDSYLTGDTAPTGFGALSFRRHVWSKKQKQEPRSESPASHWGWAGSSESGYKSFMSVTDDDDDVKPQRRGLLKRKL